MALDVAIGNLSRFAKVNVSTIKNPAEASFFDEAAHYIHDLSGSIAKVGLELVPSEYYMDTASPFTRTDIISMIPVYKPFIRWTPTLFQTTIKTSLKGATPKSVLELMNMKYLTLAHVKGHLQFFQEFLVSRVKFTALHDKYVVVISCVILVGLFSLQHLGTHRVAFLFAPIVTAWLLCISGIGVYNIFQWNPNIFRALSPFYMYRSLQSTRTEGWVPLGGVVLCITGVETMFADLGHFSPFSIKR